MNHDLHKHLRYLNLEDRQEFHSKAAEALYAIKCLVIDDQETPAQWVGILNVALDIVADMEDISSNYIKPGA